MDLDDSEIYWYHNDIEVGTSESIFIENLSRDDVVTCKVVATDSYGDNVLSISEVTVVNSPPIIENIYFQPNSIQTNQEYLKCLAETTDVNEDTATILGCKWDASTCNFEVLEYPFSFGDEIGCTVTVTDSMGGLQRNDTVENTIHQIKSICNLKMSFLNYVVLWIL